MQVPQVSAESNVPEEYAQFLRDTTWYEHAGELNTKEVAYLTLGLVGEAGEFADEFKKFVRIEGFDSEGSIRDVMDNEQRLKLILELGDVFWYLVRLCDMLGTSVQGIMIYNTLKLFLRIKEQDTVKGVKWPFTDPFLSPESVDTTWQIIGGYPNVCVNEEV